jgi:hypothetical protein
MLTKRHQKQASCEATKYKCDCGKSYSHRPSYYRHKKTCKYKPEEILNIESQVEQLKTTINEERRSYQKELDEMKAHLAILLENAGKTTHNNHHIDTQNIENQQNIHIHINAFGKENIDYIDDKAIVDCIDRVYKSVPALLEKIHFDPKHPENHNIKITNKKLPYASIMGDNRKWKTVDKKDAIEKMVHKGYDLLEDSYIEKKNVINKRERFEEFKEKFESEDKDLMKTLKIETELLVLNGQQK